MLTIAVQKSGRLSDRTTDLFKKAGIIFQNGKSGKLKSTAQNFPIELIFLRDDDIPDCISDGIVDAGIVGENMIYEKGKELQLIEKLGFAKCRLSIAVPKQFNYSSIIELEGKNIATSYPAILKKFLAEKGVKATIYPFNGSVEITTSIGLADAIFDIVSTGSTLLSNGLKEVETVMKSEAVIAANPNLNFSKKELLGKLLFRIRAVNKARNFKYILLNSPNETIDKITSILPGIKSPTIMPLALKGWSSIHTVIKEDDFWHIIESLKKAGAQGILVIPIEKMIV